MRKDDIIIPDLKQRKQKKQQQIKEDKRKLEKLLSSKKYSTEVLVSSSPLSGVYHDLFNMKDQMDSHIQSEFNKKYNDIDTMLYKLNKKIENKSNMINYKVSQKEEKIKDKLRYDY